MMLYIAAALWAAAISIETGTMKYEFLKGYIFLKRI